MSKVIEQGSNKFTTWLGNFTALPTEWIIPLFSIAIGYKENNQWQAGHISLGKDETKSLYYNSIFYFRFMLPSWIGIGVRWKGSDPTAKEYFQTGLGWKLNGRLAALFRIHSDVASAEGVQGPNYGQAIGFEYGTK